MIESSPHYFCVYLEKLLTEPFNGGSGRDVECNDTTLTRKMHKADRERLRRDHLNGQFAKLAGVLGELFFVASLCHALL